MSRNTRHPMRNAPMPKPKSNRAPPSRVATIVVEHKQLAEEPVTVAVAEPPPRASTRADSLLSLAIKRLEDNGPAACKDLVAYALSQGWTTNGKTPEATLNAALHRESKKRGARVKKLDRGTWGAA